MLLIPAVGVGVVFARLALGPANDRDVASAPEALFELPILLVGVWRLMKVPIGCFNQYHLTCSFLGQRRLACGVVAAHSAYLAGSHIMTCVVSFSSFRRACRSDSESRSCTSTQRALLIGLGNASKITSPSRLPN